MNEEILNESLECEEVITGQEVADLVGMGEIYQQGKKMEMMDNQMKNEAYGKFKSFLSRMNEVEKKNSKDMID